MREGIRSRERTHPRARSCARTRARARSSRSDDVCDRASLRDDETRSRRRRSSPDSILCTGQPSAGMMGSGGCSTGGNTPDSRCCRSCSRSASLLRGRKQLAIGVATLVTLPVGAAQLRQLTVDALSRDAIMIVHAHVTAIAVSPTGAIETDATLAIDECIAGACPATAVVRRRGGERDGIGVWVDAEAQPAVGDEVVMYLRRDAAGALRVLGGVQGLWQVVHDQGTTYAVARSAGSARARRRALAGRRRRGSGARNAACSHA